MEQKGEREGRTSGEERQREMERRELRTGTEGRGNSTLIVEG